MTEWNNMAEAVLEGHRVDEKDAYSVLKSGDDELLFVLQAAFRVRAHHHGRKVKVHVLQNAKSGLCKEDCSFCSQSTKFKHTGVDRYTIQEEEALLDGARRAVRAGASTYCMVTSTRGPSDKDLKVVCDAVRRIKKEHPTLRLCASLGLLGEGQAQSLKDAGVDRYNHNLETSKRYFPEVVGTHNFEDRAGTIRRAKDAGLEACAGGILGMGENLEDRVDLAFRLRALDVESVPVNFLNPRPGTPLGLRPKLTPQECLRALAMFRFVHPDKDVRAAGGREVCLGSMQALALYPANSIFAQGYLTTEGQGDAKDWSMIKEAGFEGVLVNS